MGTIKLDFRVGFTLDDIDILMSSLLYKHDLMKGFLCSSLFFKYRFYGEPVVKACVDEAANYVDVSGEPEVSHCYYHYNTFVEIKCGADFL